ncbi:PEGA domain-containing protein [Caldinitratiruptor microaerophilus]|uniref:PEGA domain-containing protein n=1 Tax=Caldinitratiruptor microaerophilus TaxID=671077 RepID=A0AA35G717_9FIRM|nr:PEGA domain-containing protein [Caldinitratiruptor microaerophilus]BDG59601.1 hypothetical protein caldi_06910 [Caldinitratiruptor microaerophilus]
MTARRRAAWLASIALIAATTACTGGTPARTPPGPRPEGPGAGSPASDAGSPAGPAGDLAGAPPATPGKPEAGAGPGGESPEPAVGNATGALVETDPPGAEVYLEGELLGTTPLRLPVTLPEYGMFAFLAPGYQPLYYFMNPGDAPRKVELTPLPPVPAGARLERLRALRDGLAWQSEPTRWSLQLPAGPPPRWLPSPDGERLAVVLLSQGEGKEPQDALESLVLLDPARGVRRVLAEQVVFPTRGHNTADAYPTVGFFPLGWRGADRLVVLRTTFTGEDGKPARPSIVAEEYDVDRGTVRRLAALPAVVRPIDFEEGWLSGRYAYLSTGTLYRFDLEAGAAGAVRRNMPVFEPSGTVPLAVSPDGERVLYGFYGEGLLRADTGEELPLLPAGVEPGGGAWSPDGRLLALRVRSERYTGRWLQGEDGGFLLAGAVRVVDRDGREVATLTLPVETRSARPGEGPFIFDMRWLPDSSGLVVRAARVAPGVTPDADVDTGQPLGDAGLFLLPLRGPATRVREARGNYGQIVAVGPTWALEIQSVSGGTPEPLATGWGGAGAPPLPAEPWSPFAAVAAPGGELVVVADSGTVWRCAPGAATCREAGRFGSPGWPSVHGRWLIQIAYGERLEGLLLGE